MPFWQRRTRRPTEVLKRSCCMNAILKTNLLGLSDSLRRKPALAEKRNARWLAIKLLEDDEQARGIVEQLAKAPGPILDAVQSAAERIAKAYGDTPEIAIADQRYGLIAGVCREAVTSAPQTRRLLSQRIDDVVLNRLFGIPIFLGMMYLVFKLTFALGEPPMHWIEGFFGWLGDGVGSLWPAGSQSALRSLVVDGVIGGVGGVLVFFPNIAALVSGDRRPGRLRLHGAGGIPGGPVHAQDRTARKELHPHADRLRLHGSGHHGHADAGDAPRPADRDAGLAADELRREAVDLRPVHTGVFSRGVAGAGPVDSLPGGDRLGRLG